MSANLHQCAYYDASACRSCGWLEQAYAAQLLRKQEQSKRCLGAIDERPIEWLPAFASPTTAMRNKAKMAVGGSVKAPSLGLVERGRAAVDLSDCMLYPSALNAYFPMLKVLIGRAQIQPYDPLKRQGELKFVLLTQPWPDGPVLLRLVLRSQESLDRIRQQLPWLQAQLPPQSVISVNLQPVDQAVLEGPTEILLSEQRWLPVPFNQHQLLFGTQSFLQTNSVVASALYARAAEWVDELTPARVLDLYCGVGAFAYHAAAVNRPVDAIEISAEAIAAAQASLPSNASPPIQFHCANVQQPLEIDSAVELVIVNPPRRGLGADLCESLNSSGCRNVIYSSCQLSSLETDLRRLTHYRVRRAQVFDMFPHTKHFEVLVLLERGT